MARSFAIVPAAGKSARMGQPKLLMPLGGGQPLIAYPLAAWHRGGVDRIVVVMRADDMALQAAVRSLAAPSVELVLPDVPPPDMKASIQAALRHIERQHAPTTADCFLVAPADLPQLSSAVISALIAQRLRHEGSILAPTLAGRRGHPVLFPWHFAAKVHALAADEGLNVVVDRHDPVEIDCDRLVPENERPFADLDTPEEYQRLAGEY